MLVDGITLPLLYAIQNRKLDSYTSLPNNPGMQIETDWISRTRERLIAVMLLLLCIPIFLFFQSWPAFAAHQERLILSVESGQCSFRVEADDESHTLRLRIQPEDSACHCSKEEMQSILKKAFEPADPPKLNGTYTSIFIGRLIEYPWLSEYLAANAYRDRMWDRRRGKPVSMDINRYVKNILSRREITASLDEPLAASGYRIAAASVEKVLVGGFRDVPQYKGPKPAGKVPYDAMTWFKLEKR